MIPKNSYESDQETSVSEVLLPQEFKKANNDIQSHVGQIKPCSSDTTKLQQSSAHVVTSLLKEKTRMTNEADQGPAPSTEDSGRERLKRHRVEVAGRVWIPDIWGQEEQLKDWIDCRAFDASAVMNSSIMLARAALVEEGRRATSSRLRIENGC
ncbi:hypothetical protein ACH5RR_004579 [Cinchona calisaya]|uniref:Uncharacterized protein n=1 Tax=Cinchona calisaya TaxID=153742 RepID=A0ABD3AYL5_9GENT